MSQPEDMPPQGRGLVPASWLWQRLSPMAKRLIVGSGMPTIRLRRLQQTIVLAYHGIGDARGVPLPAFEQQLRYIKRHFEPVFARDLGKPSKQNRLRVAVTFDDGLKNTRDVALPLLRDIGVKATVFALPGSVRWLWIAEVRERLRLAAISGPTPDLRRLLNGRNFDEFVLYLKRLPPDPLGEELDRIRFSMPFEPSPDWLAANELMTADDLRALPADMIEIGGHTVTHPILDRLPDVLVEKEIVGSKVKLEELLQRPVETFAYPNGDFDERSLKIAAENFRYAFTTNSAMAGRRSRQKFHGHRSAINRLHGAHNQFNMPLHMLAFMKQGYGFSPGNSGACCPDL